QFELVKSPYGGRVGSKCPIVSVWSESVLANGRFLKKPAASRRAPTVVLTQVLLRICHCGQMLLSGKNSDSWGLLLGTQDASRSSVSATGWKFDLKSGKASWVAAS